MAETLSTRRPTFALVLIVALLVAGVATGVHALGLRRQEQRRARCLQTLQNLLVATHREMAPERFLPWLEQMDFHAWQATGWNLAWLAPDLTVRWSLRPAKPGEFPAELRDALRDLPASEPGARRHLRARIAGRVHRFDLCHLAPADPAAGGVVAHAPRPRFFADFIPYWLGAAGGGGALIAIFAGYRWLLVLRLRAVLRAAGPPGDPGFVVNQPLDSWARQHATLASRRVAEERDHFDALFDLLQDGTLVLDAADRVVRANTTALRLLQPGTEPLGGRRLAGSADGEALVALAGDIRRANAYRAAEIPLQGGAVPCNAAGVPLHDPADPGARHVLLVLRDISRMRRLERAGEEYATNVSHELKTPLTLILGYTETLLAHPDMEPAFRERSLQTIEQHARRILRIIDDLLRLAWLKNEQHAAGIPRAPVPVAPMVAEAVALCREWACSAGVVIETHIPPELTWSLNAGLMEEALVNLVKNAILYALAGPVEIGARVLADGRLELAVRDRGPGLRPEDAARIFERFYRVDKGRARAAGGSGLGLPIVQQIVEAHRGTARVATAPGEGCVFILEIPPA